MANINQINESAQTIAASSTKAAKKGGADAFGDALSKAFDKTPVDKMQQAPATALKEIASAQPNVIQSSDIVSGKTDKLLDMLDKYSAQLQDPGVTLKTIEPVLEEINLSAGTLLKETQNLTAEDENLKRVATQTIVAAQTEYLKFQRGDYSS